MGSLYREMCRQRIIRIWDSMFFLAKSQIRRELCAVHQVSTPGGARRNQNRTLTAISNMPRLTYGHKCDLVFQKYDNGHNSPLESGVHEAKPKIEEDSNFMQEGFIKLPRMLK